MPKFYTIAFWFSISLMIAAIISILAFGLKLGVDFRGGSLMEIEFTKNRPETEAIKKTLTVDSLIKNADISPIGERGFIIRSDELSEQQHQNVLRRLEINFKDNPISEKRFDSVGPVIGQELKRRSIIAIIIVLVAINVYIAFVFRKMARVLSPWAMGIAAVVALLHDVMIPTGVFALLGRYAGVEIGAVFVAAALTILGFSVSDTVVIFDRVRENVLRYGSKENFGQIVHKSVMQTLTRSLNTTFTTLLSLFAIYFFGGESIKYFSLALIIGIFLGAYSSFFVASPLLVWWSRSR